MAKRRKQNFTQKANLTPLLEKTTLQTLQRNDLLVGNKIFGMVEKVINKTTLMVYVDQATEREIVNCSPHVDYQIGDRVLIEYINNNPHDMFVTGTIGGGYPIDQIDYSSLPDEPVEIIYNEENKAVEFIYGYTSKKTTWRQELERNEEGKVIAVLHYYPDGYVLVRNLIRREDGKVTHYE